MQDTFTGYIPKVGDRVRIVQHPQHGPFFAGQVGTVRAVAPNLTNCQIRLDAGLTDRRFAPLKGLPGVRFFPGEVALIDTSDLSRKS